MRSLTALAIGFPVGITAAFLFTLISKCDRDLLDSDFSGSMHPLTQFISKPDDFSFIVACFAGAAGMLSLTSAKSGALIGVLISVTTIPAAANIGVAVALGDWSEWRGAMAQLGGQPDRDRAGRRHHPLDPAPALRAAAATPLDDDSAPSPACRASTGPERTAPMIRQLAIMLAAFVLGTAVAGGARRRQLRRRPGGRPGLLRRDAGLGPTALSARRAAARPASGRAASSP